MPRDTATLALNGEVLMRDFVTAAEQFLRLVTGLEQAVASDAKIDWRVEALEAGSALITLRGVSTSDVRAIPRVISAYERVCKAVQHGKPLPMGKV